MFHYICKLQICLQMQSFKKSDKYFQEEVKVYKTFTHLLDL